MMTGKIGAEIGRAGRHRRGAVLHFDKRRRTIEQAERDRAIVATQAKPRRTGWLADGGLHRGAGVRSVTGRGKRAVPERGLTGAMRRVAKNADFRFSCGTDWAGTADG